MLSNFSELIASQLAWVIGSVGCLDSAVKTKLELRPVLWTKCANPSIGASCGEIAQDFVGSERCYSVWRNAKHTGEITSLISATFVSFPDSWSMRKLTILSEFSLPT